MKIEMTCRVELEGEAGVFGEPPPRLSDEELRGITAYWQDKLRLLHWDLQVSYAPSHELGEDGRQAEVAYHEESHTAKIRLLDPAFANPEDWPWRPWEENLIHELLHLVMAPIRRDGDRSQKKELEIIINNLAHALYEQRVAGKTFDDAYGFRVTKVDQWESGLKLPAGVTATGKAAGKNGA